MAVEKSRKEAQNVVEALGMAKQLKDNECWEYPPIPAIKEEDMVEGNDDDEDDYHGHVETETGGEVIPFLLQEENVRENPGDVVCGIAELKKLGIIDKSLCEHLTALQKVALKRLPSTGLPIYDVKDNQQCEVSLKKARNQPRSVRMLKFFTMASQHSFPRPQQCGCFKREREYHLIGSFGCELSNHFPVNFNNK